MTAPSDTPTSGFVTIFDDTYDQPDCRAYFRMMDRLGYRNQHHAVAGFRAGLAEMMRLAVAEGGRAETVMGLSGAGDLILTAMSATSRNTSFGIALGEGRSAQSTLSQRSAVTEGYWTAQAVVALAARAGIEMPIAQAVNSILGGDVDIDEAIGKLLERPVTVEF